MDDLDRLLDRLDRRFSVWGRKFAAALSQEGLSGPQYLMLHLIADMGPVNPSDLARLFNVSLSSVTAAVNRMVRDGLVRRYEDEANRRYVVIEMTEHGRHLLLQTETKRRVFIRSQFGKFSPNELSTFAVLLEKLMED